MGVSLIRFNLSMNPTATHSSGKFHKSKIPTPKGNVHGVRHEATPSEEPRISFERGKSGGELKQRLASVVSAKIASANRDGRTPNTNRGIGYLLQRKQQQQHDTKLNTKAISFQKPLRNSRGEESGNGDGIKSKIGGDLKSGASDLSKSASQKSLLSAFMSSRTASGTIRQGQKPAVKPRPINPTPADGLGRPTSGSRNNISNPDKSFPYATAAKVDDKDSRTLSSSLQEKKAGKSFGGTKAVTSTSYRNGQQDKEKPSLLTKKIPNSMPRDKVGSRSLGVNNINGSQMAQKNALPTKETPNKQHLSENQNPGNIRMDSKTTSKLEISSLRNAVPRNRPPVSKKHDKFHEDLLEKLEADVGSCKIAAFQNMEDFSVLRMRVYRIRGDLEQLKKERERGYTSLIA